MCVFCGSSSGSDPAYVEAAGRLGRLLADEGITLVYGGARVGLMGAVADAALGAGGKVIGVLPDFLKRKELEHPKLTELLIVSSMPLPSIGWEKDRVMPTSALFLSTTTSVEGIAMRAKLSL